MPEESSRTRPRSVFVALEGRAMLAHRVLDVLAGRPVIHDFLRYQIREHGTRSTDRRKVTSSNSRARARECRRSRRQSGVPRPAIVGFADLSASTFHPADLLAIFGGAHFAFSRNDVTTLTAIAAITKTLGHGGRLRVLAMLRGGPLSVCQIAAVLDAPVSTVSGHLLELRRAGLVDERRQGKWVYYRLTNAERIIAVLAPVLAAIERDSRIRRDATAAAALHGRSPSALCEATELNSARRLP
jgi:ArsR family transcriptional regulator, arsenate/arsenite/antimonite-responsive transcriptional repressor